MKLVVHTFLTLDGVMQGPGGAEEDTSNGFTRGGWMMPFVDKDFGEIVTGWFQPAAAILLGRNTYTMMSAYWPQVDEPDDIVAVKLNGLPKYVASTTLRDPEWHDTTVLPDNLEDRVRELKRQPGGELQVHGSWALAQALHRAGLVDEYRLLVFPTTVGGGKRLFGEDAAPSGYTLVDSRVTSTGVSHLVLRPTPFEVGHVTDAAG